MSKYLFLAVEGGFFPQMIREETVRPGSYMWYRAFDEFPGWSGEIRHVQDVANTDFQRYDIVHINLAGVATQTIPTIKDLIKNSSTKLIVNLDNAVEKIDEIWKGNYREFLIALRSADFVFAQEPFQRSLLQALWTNLCGRKEKIPLICHPVDTEGLKKFYIEPEKRLDMVACMFHRYDGQLIIPSIIARGGQMRTKGQFHDIKVEVPAILFGYTERLVDLTIFDVVAVRKDWDKYVYLLAHCTQGLSYYTIHAMDRFLAECACLGVPAVSTTCSYFGRALYPRTTFSPIALQRMMKTMSKLKEDEQFWNVVKDYAWNRVEEFGDKPSVERLLNRMREWGIKI